MGKMWLAVDLSIRKHQSLFAHFGIFASDKGGQTLNKNKNKNKNGAVLVLQ